MKGRTSIKDVAKAAGVSPATVSNALNHPERVRPDPLARIDRAIRDLGYVRSEPARHLRSGRSSTIGLLLLDASNLGFIEMAEGVEDAIADTPWSVLMSNSRRDPAREAQYLRVYSEQQAAGLIVTPRDGTTPELENHYARGTPVVLLDRHGDAGDKYSVSVDDNAGGRAAAEHLIGLGHRQIAFVGDLTAAYPVRERFAGVEQAVERANTGKVAYPVRLRHIDAELSIKGGRSIGHQLAAAQRPTAVIAAIDLLAVGILQALMSEGVQVPRDISLCGYDDTEFAGQLATPLTSVRRPHYQLGTSAGRMLLTLLDGKEPDEVHLVYTPQLIVRASTGPPRSPLRSVLG